jgi:signal transduction histidine kinase
MRLQSGEMTFSGRLAKRLSPDRLLWAVWVRWLVIAGFLTLAAVAHALGLFASIVPVVQVAVIGSVLNALNDWCVRRGRYVVTVTSVAIPMDHLLSTYLVVNSGGVRSPFMMLYIVQVLATAMLVDTRVAAGSAGLAILLWSAGVSLQAAGYLDASPLFLPGAAHTGEALYRGAWAAFFLYCLALLVYLGGYISERLRTSERDLADKNRRLEEALASVRTAHQQLGEAYERLKQTETQLVHAEKMRSLGVLMAGIAHELNNPISFVAANIEHLRSFTDRLRQALDLYASAALPAATAAQAAAMRRELRLDQVLADLPGVLDDCEEGARRTTQIVSELRSFSRSDEPDGWRPTDLHRGIASTLRLLAPQLKEPITVHRDFGDLPEVECLPGQMNQVFMNLLANAADALGHQPGTIWITTRQLHDGPPPQVRIAIRDDGPGMTPELQARIFEPFFTTKDVGQGTGLGLSVSYAIVQRHRGTLTVESAPGAGATFTITLPVRRNET